ncbi:MAG: type II secretion system F family protein [Chthoniobacterales bacterium]
MIALMQLPARAKEILFADLAELIRSGMTFRESLERISRHSRRLRGVVTKMLSAGNTPEECFGVARSRFDEVDFSVLFAGIESGRLEQSFVGLSAYYATVVECRKQFFRGLAYPLFVFNLGVFIINIPTAVVGAGVGAYFREVFQALMVFYLLLIGGYFLTRFLLTMVAMNPALQRRFRFIPLLGSLPYQLALWRYTLISSLLIASGLSIYKALDMGAKGCKNALIQRATAEIIIASRAGGNLSDAFSETAAFPEEVTRAVTLGETAGRLDFQLASVASLMQREFISLVQFLAELAPKLIYILIVLYLGFRAYGMMQGVSSEIHAIQQPLE